MKLKEYTMFHSDSFFTDTQTSEDPSDFYPRGSTGTSGAADSQYADVSLRILKFLQDSALTAFPAFPEAFGRLRLRKCSQMKFPLETDGFSLFYDPEQLVRSFLESADRLKCLYLHIHLHCIGLHPVCYDTGRLTNTANAKDRMKYRDMACDLAVAWMMRILLRDRSGCSYLSAPLPDASEFEKQGLTDILWTDPYSLIPLLAGSESLREFARQCALDSHCFWYSCKETGTASPGAKDTRQARVTPDSRFDDFRYRQTQLKLWGTLHKSLQEITVGSGKRGIQGGTTVQSAELQRRNTIDYHRFLQQFTISREEPVLDMDSFDYIPYHYGMELSDEKLLLLEPLEYKEVNRLDELAIAIDTSGSCSGRIVRRFLEETWSILRQKENFFSRMRLHLIQCDSMIQEHRIFTSAEEWEAAIPGFQVLGQGNTDFRPVFELLDRKVQKKEIRHLRGLLYFSDGDGIFPKEQPVYDTAFVFLKEPDENLKIPDWIIHLNLNLTDSEV